MTVQNIATDGGTLAVEVQGPPSGPLVICCPAMGDTRESYGPLATQLVQQGYTVAIMDPRGHGESSTGFQRYGDDATADDFITIAEKLAPKSGSGKADPAIFAGCSFAAGAAVIAAGRRPELVAGLILLAPFIRRGMGAVGTKLMPLMFVQPWGPTMWRMYAKTLWPGLGDEAATARAKKTTDLLTRPDGRWAAFQATVSGADHIVVEPYIKRVKAPVLVVMGEKDPDWKDPVAEAAWIATQFKPVKSLNVPEAGHAPMLERPEIVGKETLAFLQGLRSGETFTAVAA